MNKIIDLTFIDFENDENKLFNVIIDHKNSSNCVDCIWTIGIVGYENIERIKKIKKDCVLIITLEHELIGNVVEKLIMEYEFEVVKIYQPVQMILSRAILIYCEPNK